MRNTEKLPYGERIGLMFDLLGAFGQIKNTKEAADFLEDLLTANEIKNISIRLRIAKLLLSGSTQREISRKLHTSLGTVNKISIWLTKGGVGFKKVISKLPAKWSKQSKIIRGPIEFHLPELAFATTEHIIVRSQESLPKNFIAQADSKKELDKELREYNQEAYSKHTRK